MYYTKVFFGEDIKKVAEAINTFNDELFKKHNKLVTVDKRKLRIIPGNDTNWRPTIQIFISYKTVTSSDNFGPERVMAESCISYDGNAEKATNSINNFIEKNGNDTKFNDTLFCSVNTKHDIESFVLLFWQKTTKKAKTKK